MSRLTICRSAAFRICFAKLRVARPGFFRKVGLGTFVDPANGGGKLNARTTEELVRLIEIDGEQWLFLQGVSDQCRDHPRDHGGSQRQHLDGEGGANPR